MSFLFKIILSLKSSNSLWGADALLFLEFLNIVFVSVLQLYWNHCVVIYFFSNFIFSIQIIFYLIFCYKNILFSKFSDVLHAFDCARAIGNLWNICLEVNILSPLHFVAFIGKIPFLKSMKN